jgi:hypothetical protein
VQLIFLGTSTKYLLNSVAMLLGLVQSVPCTRSCIFSL